MNKNSSISWQNRAAFWSKDEAISLKDRESLQKMILDQDNQAQKNLAEMFHQELEFGTAGLRGIVGLGTNRMNIYNVRKASHALAISVKKYFKPADQKVAISFDSRLTSYEFAQIAAEILSAHQIHCYIADRPTATPILSYAVRYWQCAAGIMVTASHNPKDYNGFKVYGSDGAQITPPIDLEIMTQYQAIKSLNEIPVYTLEKNPAWTYFPEALYQTYYQKIQEATLRPDLCKSQGSKLKIVYTPLHGTGLEPVKFVLNQLGFSDFHAVTEQAQPDGNFPTADYPNPEDPKALNMALALMQKINADVAIGSDPDTDRMGVILKLSHGEKFLSGNEIATLLLYYKLLTLAEQKKLTPDSIVLKSIVTSSFQEKLCEKFGVKLINTLTGFKWMAEILRHKEEKSEKFNFIFASEESFGSMPNCFVRDKDGVAAAALLCEALLYFKNQNLDFDQIFQQLYEQYGYVLDIVLNYQFPGIAGMQQMKTLMQQLSSGAIATDLALPMDAIEDYADGFALNIKTQKKTVLTLPKTPMLGLVFSNGSKVFVRPSGTEPKIKFYLLLQGKDKKQLQVLAEKITGWIETQIKIVRETL